MQEGDFANKLKHQWPVHNVACSLQLNRHSEEPFKHILVLINDGHIHSANSAKSGTFPLKIVRTKLIYSWNWLLQARNIHTTLSWWSNNNNQVRIATNSWECRKWCFNSLVHLTIHAMAYFHSSSSQDKQHVLLHFHSTENKISLKKLKYHCYSCQGWIFWSLDFGVMKGSQCISACMSRNCHIISQDKYW